MTIYLGRCLRSRRVRPTQDVRNGSFLATRCVFRRVVCLLFGLSPGGVCHAPRVALGPVVSYTAVPSHIIKYEKGRLRSLSLKKAGAAVSPSPVRKFLTGCLFSVALSVLSIFRCASLRITKHPTLWSPDFPPPPEYRRKRSSLENIAP